MGMNILSLLFISLALSSARSTAKEKLKVYLKNYIESELKDYMETDSENYMQNDMEKSTEYASYNDVTEMNMPEERKVGTAWPSGSWGLPKTNRGCPENRGFTWHTGMRKHDGANEANKNDWSRPNHFAQTGRDIEQHFCIKTSGGGGNWPAGEYCIYRKNGWCPRGFSSGSVYWDDEDVSNSNSKSGYVPDGVYDRNTLIEYCCRKDGDPYNAITLPTNTPFYLLRKNHVCQKVANTQVSFEYLFFDNEDTGNTDRTSGSHPYEDGGPKDHKLHYCYYQPA